MIFSKYVDGLQVIKEALHMAMKEHEVLKYEK
jgi:hypothetical protein